MRMVDDPSHAVAAQNFRYKVSNILDKPTESLFGYIAKHARFMRIVSDYEMGLRITMTHKQSQVVGAF